ncbi:MAG: hypothetical protein ACKOXP_09800 [Flavobacteriales bacterium]
MAQFKFIPPGSLYAARNMHIRTAENQIFTLYPLQALTIPDEQISEIHFKLDYHKKSVSPEILTADENYYIVYLHCRKVFPLNYFDLMFRNCLQVKQVSKAQFELPFETQVLENTERKLDKNHRGFIALTGFTLFLCILQVFTLEDLRGSWLTYPQFWYLSIISLLDSF